MTRPVLLVAALIALGCASLPRPEPADVPRAQARWPSSSLGELEEGRRLYVARCAGCHWLEMPDQRRPDEWPKAVSEMSDEAELTETERALIERFLVTMSERPKR